MKILDKITALSPSDIKAIYITFGFLAISFILHVFAFSSPMRYSEESWINALNFHMTWAPFKVRPIQDYTTLALHKFIGLPIREAFFLIQFSLAAALGFSFYRLLMLLEFGAKWSHVGLTLLMSAYPIYAAHFEPTHTWDDFWCYLALVLMVIALIKNRPIRAGILFFVACLAREQSALFLPLLFFWNNPLADKTSRKRFLITAVAPLVLFILYRLIIWEDIDPKRWQLLSFNFEHATRTTDSVVSFIISFGFIWILFPIGMLTGKNQIKNKAMRTIRMTAPIVLVLNTLVTLFFTFVRETRILFPPFVLVIPVAVIAVKDLSQKFSNTMRSGKTLSIKVTIILVTFGYLLTTLLLFNHFDYKSNSEMRRPLARIYLIADIVIFLYWIILKVKVRYFSAQISTVANPE